MPTLNFHSTIDEVDFFFSLPPFQTGETFRSEKVPPRSLVYTRKEETKKLNDEICFLFSTTSTLGR